MKDLKHIKLFEAFESVKLSKTMGFIDRSSRTPFLNELKVIASKIEYPLSNLSDDLFEYLPFRSALKKTVTLAEDQPDPCNHQSDWISGEYCQGGQVKRTWGSKTRIVTCNYCEGTGFKKKRMADPELSLIKFWFDKDGKYILTTGTDGKIRKQLGNSTGYKGSGTPVKFSRNINDYEIGEELDYQEVMELPTGTILRVKIREYDSSQIGMVWRGVERPNRCFIIQDNNSGGSDDTSEWRNYGEGSWVVNSRNDLYKAEILIPKNQKVEVKPVQKENFFDRNGVLNTRYLSISDARDVEEKLKGAHFALVLDFIKMKQSTFEKTPLTQKNRKERVKGALALEKPENIKTANIQRYINALADKFDKKNGLSEITKIVPRALGWNNSVTFILKGVNVDEINSIISNLYAMMKNPDDGDGYTRIIKQSLKSIYERTGSYNQLINKNIQDFYRLSKSKKDTNWESKVRVFTKYLELGQALNTKLSSMPSETIGDLEIIYQKIVSLKSTYGNGRFSDLRKIKHMLDYMLYENAGRYLINEIDDLSTYEIDAILKEMDEYKKIIER